MMAKKLKPLRFAAIFVLVLVFMLAGCRSRVITVNLINTSTEPVKTIIVDYPTATFGRDKLAPGETFSYVIKPLEKGHLKIQFSDAQGNVHTFEGVSLHKNDEGWINVKFSQTFANVGFDITVGEK
jgi:multisubunit Na+/H+ antiporter MnhE subunit